MKNLSWLDTILFSLLIVAGLGVAYVCFLESHTLSLQFTDQARNFLHLKPYLASGYQFIVINQNGHQYWPLGPLPSVILLPFMAIWHGFSQVHLQVVLIILLGYLAYRLARLKNFSDINALYVTGAFMLGSTVVGVISSPQSWYYSHVVILVLTMLALLEWQTKKRPWVMGLLSALLLVTRIPMVFVIALFAYWVWREYKLKALVQLAIPLVIAALLLGWFNWARFGNPLETGYEKAKLTPYTQTQKNLGRFGMQHVPSNIYYYFLSSVWPVRHQTAHLFFPYYTYSTDGLSVFIVAPFFVYALARFRKFNAELIPIWITVGVFMAFYLLYYHAGWIQYGPRYVNDFFPLLYLLVLVCLPSKLTANQKILITLSSLLNAYLLLSPFLL